MPDNQELQRALLRLEGNSYKAYKRMRASYSFADFRLHIDHVQGDPFAAPSRMRVVVPQQRAGYPEQTFANRSRSHGLCTYLATRFAHACRRRTKSRGSGKSGLIEIDALGQQIIERTAILVDDRAVEARFVVGLLANGRRILGQQAAAMLCEDVPGIVQESLFFANSDPEAIDRYTQTSEDTDHLRHL